MTHADTLQDLVAAPDIVAVAERTHRAVVDVAATHFAVEGMFRLGKFGLETGDLLLRQLAHVGIVERGKAVQFGTHGADGSSGASPRHMVSATRFAPSTVGWMPSAWLSFTSAATPSRSVT